ncbi:site-specific integrase [Myroides sp. JBRI-B21084]|uniref:site-specific integrase n=1 Tax=Myroides sp. JBRI-B21084 TaxID=3119977 RepID=UPI0026E1BBA7|nr:site-specific integrase [Paenimyroides cloacae]WKW46737.1 site-specific integrase [Paenimyroides cloacae]
MQKIKFKTIYNRKKALNKEGKALIQVECYLNGKRKYLTTNIYLEPKYWSEKTATIKTDYPNSIFLNKSIKDLINRIEEIELEHINKNRSFNLESIETFLNSNKPQSFTEFMTNEIEEMNLKVGTKKNHTATLSKLNEFRKVVYFDDLNYDFLDRFKKHLIKKYNPSKNTIYKYFKHIKTHVNTAINKGYIDLKDYPFRTFKVEQEESKKVYLTPQEIIKIEDVELETDAQKYVRDMFMFSVYTGLRYGDVFALTRNNIKNIEGSDWLVLDMEKTSDVVKIPIDTLFNGKPKRIINKYTVLGRNLCFKEVTNQHCNRILKEIKNLAKVDKKITFHSARHTTATYLIYKGVPITTVGKILGHRKLETTQIYAHIMDQTITNDIKAVNFD